jgi:FkbM family methyltransferase
MTQISYIHRFFILRNGSFRNLKSFPSSTVLPFNYAVGESDCIDEFKYFHSLPGESTRHGDEQLERSKVLGMDSSGQDDIVICNVRTLKTIVEREAGPANILRTHGRIDLLKIDAEGDELNILNGMGSDLFACVKQIVVEVFDINDRLLSVVDILRKNSYDIEIAPQVCKSKIFTMNIYL